MVDPSSPKSRLFPGIPDSIQDRFIIKRRLGAGSFGTVYEAFDRQRNGEVALKTLHRLDPSSIFRFKNEFRALVSITHPNLVTLHELFAVDGQWFCTMDLIRGVDFTTHVRGTDREDSTAALDVPRLRRAVRGLIEGVEACHAAGYLHRDIKPSNVLVETGGRVVLLDFGLSVAVDVASHKATLQSSFVGTPGYMAPELFLGQPATEAVDWYAVGVVILEALTGRRPADASTMRAGRAPMNSPSALSGAPADLGELCERLLDADPAMRPSGRELSERFGVFIPRRISRLPPAKLVGRASSLRVLREAWATAKQGRTVIVRLSGHCGVGKTTFVRHFRQELESDPKLAWLEGRCYEHESVPFKALDVLLDDIGRRVGADADLLTQLADPASIEALLRCFPSLARLDVFKNVALADDDWHPGELRERAFTALRSLIDTLATRGSVVIFLDDLQWGDSDSAAGLRALLSDERSRSIMLIACHRSVPDNAGPVLGLLWELERRRAITTYDITLAPLEPIEAEQLVRDWMPQCDDLTLKSIARERAGTLARNRRASCCAGRTMHLASQEFCRRRMS